MVILLPSYKRTDILHLVIKSVVACNVNKIDDRIVLLIVNNYFPNKQIVDTIIATLEFPKRIQCKVIHRKHALIPLESWFTAIFSIARENEVICLLGDDDLLLPWGLENRYRQINESKADMLVTDYFSHLYFLDKGKSCWLNGEFPSAPTEKSHPVSWEYLPKEHPSTSFISNHCYRNTRNFRQGYETAMNWSRSQDWIPLEMASGNVPFYIPYAIKTIGGKVVSSLNKNVLRGCVVEETFKQEYADGGNTAFYGLLIFNIFSNECLHGDTAKFNELKKIFMFSFSSGWITILWNNKITLKMLFKTIKKSKLRTYKILCSNFSSNFKLLLVKICTVLKNFTIKKNIRAGSFLPTEKFLKSLDIKTE